MKTKYGYFVIAFVLAAYRVSQSDALFDNIKACLKGVELKQAGVCFTKKFTDLIDALGPIPLSTSSSDGYKSDVDEIVGTLYSSANGRLTSRQQLHKVRAIGANSYPLRAYLSKIQRDSEQHLPPPGHQNDLATLVDVFDDFVAVLQRTGSLQQDSAHKGDAEELLVEVHQRKLETHTKQLVLGRIVPLLADELGGRLKYLNKFFQSYSDEDQLAEDNGRTESIQELLRIVQCLRAQEEETFEDSFDWSKCFFTCKDLIVIAPCVQDVIQQTPACSKMPWLGDMFIRLFTDFMQLNRCYFDIVSSPETLVEGGSLEMFEFRSYLPPSVHCYPPDLVNAKRPGIVRILIQQAFQLVPPCKVVIYATTSNYLYSVIPYIPALNVSMPRCRNGSAINQIAIGWHENAGTASGIIPLTMSNWNSTFRLPLAAVIDQKSERPTLNPNAEEKTWNTTVQFTLKFEVDGVRMNTTKVPITVIDREEVKPSTCQSINDPHIVTFDGRFYNNLYQGYFQFYKSNVLPYEVQVAYQACNESTPQSCTCGVAIRFDNDVFVVDKCRQQDACSKNDPDCGIMRVMLYLNGDLTPGTNIYQTDEGLGFQVVLPTGERLKVKSNGNFLNVWFTPSMYDWENTEGLCGVFNGIIDDDLTLPDGTTCSTPDCRVSSGFQPGTFIEAWRLNANETIFNGAAPAVDNPILSTNFCRCSHVIVAGIRCVCGYDMLVDTCDIDLGNQFTASNISALFYPTRHSETDDRRFDLAFVPPALAFKNGWTLQSAQSHCRSVLTAAGFQPLLLPGYFLTFCVNDIQIAGNPVLDWELSVIEAAKEYTAEQDNRRTRIERSTVEIPACLNGCYRRGVCINSTCSCQSPYHGPDCSQVENNPTVVVDPVTLCDVRSQDCSFATAFGKSFYNHSIQCNLQSLKVFVDDYFYTPTSATVGVLYISPNQIACQLKTYMTSYEITVVSKDKSLGDAFTFMAYDSECYECDVTKKECTFKKSKSYCYTGGKCYADLQKSASDDCLLCNATSDARVLTQSPDPVCVQKLVDARKKSDSEQKEKEIRVIVSTSLSALIVLVTIIVFIVNRHVEKKALKKAQSKSSPVSFDDISDAKGKPATANLAAETQFSSPTYVNDAPPNIETEEDEQSRVKGDKPVESTQDTRPISDADPSPSLRSRVNGVKYPDLRELETSERAADL